MSNQATKLSVDQLRHLFDPAQFDFSSTEKLPVYEGIIGQERALRAISFGVNIKSQGYQESPLHFDAGCIIDLSGLILLIGCVMLPPPVVKRDAPNNPSEVEKGRQRGSRT